VLESRRQVPIRVLANLPFFTRDHANPRLRCRVTALSPSNADFDRFLRSISALYPQLRTSKSLRIPDPQPNDLSVAMKVEIGAINILLGADVEEHGDPARGWSAILASQAGQAKAGLFKIAHHGSVTGHHDGIWTALLSQNPPAILTPWNRGSKLPTQVDCDRILSHTNLAYATSRPVSARAKRKDPAVEKTLDEANITVRDAEPPTGFVHLRMSLKNYSWEVTLSDEALMLRDFAA
jgi:hypothetical protein